MNYVSKLVVVLHVLVTFLCSILLVTSVSAQTSGADKVDEYQELLGLSLKCSPGLGTIGDIVAKSEEELISRNASEFRTLKTLTQQLGGKNKRSVFKTTHLAYFSDISRAAIDDNPPPDLAPGTVIRMICKGSNRCFRATMENGAIELSDDHQLYFCDQKTAANALLALKELIRIAPKPAVREPSGLCEFRQPNKQGMFPLASLGGRSREDVFLMDGGSVSILSMSKDSRGRNWARVQQQGESIGFVPREYLTCDN
jgi:hypothetical protein